MQRVSARISQGRELCLAGAAEVEAARDGEQGGTSRLAVGLIVAEIEALFDFHGALSAFLTRGDPLSQAHSSSGEAHSF